jgi:hypothetical protein
MSKISKIITRQRVAVLIRSRPHRGVGGGTITPDTTDPTITSSISVSHIEGEGFSLLLTANEAVTWSIVGGTDAALFNIASEHFLSLSAKDYEIPIDADNDNVYEVTVRATDGSGNTADQDITFTVTDIDDIVPVNLIAPAISGTRLAGETLTTTDGSWSGTPTIVYTYQWKRNGSNIGLATANTYTLIAGDVDTTITSEVTATNAFGAVSSISSGALIVENVPVAPTSFEITTPSTDNTPTFSIGLPFGLSGPDNAAVGDALRIQEDNNWTFFYTLLSADITAHSVTIDYDSGLTPLTDGSHTIHARLERGALVSDFSVDDTIVINTAGASGQNIGLLYPYAMV